MAGSGPAQPQRTLRAGLGTGRIGFSNADFDDIIHGLLRTTGDRAKQLRLHAQAECVMLEETPLISTYSYKIKRLVQPSVDGPPVNLARACNTEGSYIKPDPGAAAREWQSD